MQWDTDQYARLFKVMSFEFWHSHRFWPYKSSPEGLVANGFGRRPSNVYASSWRRYLKELSINSNDISAPASSWGDLCDKPGIKMKILYDYRIRRSESSRRFKKALFAAHDQENVFITDPSSRSFYFDFNDWSVGTTRDRSSAEVVESIVGCGELLAVPKHTAESILVLGLP